MRAQLLGFALIKSRIAFIGDAVLEGFWSSKVNPMPNKTCPRKLRLAFTKSGLGSTSSRDATRNELIPGTIFLLSRNLVGDRFFNTWITLTWTAASPGHGSRLVAA